MIKTHSMYIPIMGIGFTIDTPLKVSQYGIDSSISLIDDMIIEKFRKYFCEKYEIPYKEITDKIDDFRAKRITSYLNLINDLSQNKFEELKNNILNTKDAIYEYLNMFPDNSTLKQDFKKLTEKYFNFDEIKTWLKNYLSMGSIDVNIMTKIDKDNYIKNKKLPIEYNDAHAALRGFANSNLKSSMIFSAGMNPRLFNYMEQFEDFYPDKNGYIKKKVVLKVSDFRSALIQGKFLAKKGIWVSEYRIESGLNCGGHAFATEGYLMGPILEEFKKKKEELKNTMNEILSKALLKKNKIIPSILLSFKLTVQGGVGTAEEHQFLLDYYGVDSVGWGSPFLLVPEVINVDRATIKQLEEAKEEDLYLSEISPLGVLFNNLKNNTKDLEKESLIKKGTPGSVCPKKYIALNQEYGEKGLCASSSQYQNLKIKELNNKNLSAEEYKKEYEKITNKACLCVGLGTSALILNGMNTYVEGEGVSVCPGPNLAYFSKEMSLKEIMNHIYGKFTGLVDSNRPNMFIKELSLYIDFLKKKTETMFPLQTPKDEKYLQVFSHNLKEGISYYTDLFASLTDKFKTTKSKILSDLKKYKEELSDLISKINMQDKDIIEKYR